MIVIIIMIKEVLQDGFIACWKQIKRIDSNVCIVVVTVFSLRMTNWTGFIDWITQPKFVAPTMFDFKVWNDEEIVDTLSSFLEIVEETCSG